MSILKSLSESYKSITGTELEAGEDSSMEVNEISKKTLGSYINKATDQVRGLSYMQGRSDEKEPNVSKRETFPKEKASSRKAGIKKAVAKLTKEDVDQFTSDEITNLLMSEEYEQLDELSKNTLKSYIKKSSFDAAVHADKGGMKMGSGEKDAFKDYTKTNKRINGISKAVEKLTKEQVEEIEALAIKHGLVS